MVLMMNKLSWILRNILVFIFYGKILSDKGKEILHVLEKRACLNPLKSNGISHSYQLDQSFSGIKVVG